MKINVYKWKDDGEKYSLVGPNDRRRWMDDFAKGHPYQCAPLRYANVSEWWVIGHERTFVRWDPRNKEDLISIHGLGESHFGYGIVSFRLPFVFDVEAPWCLMVKGPANVVIPNAHPLEGVIDPRAYALGFSMNWQIQEGGTAIFEKDQPVAAITLVDPASLHEAELEIRPVTDHPKYPELDHWVRKRKDLFEKMLKGEEGPFVENVYTKAVRKTLPGVRFRGLRVPNQAERPKDR